MSDPHRPQKRGGYLVTPPPDQFGIALGLWRITVSSQSACAPS